MSLLAISKDKKDEIRAKANIEEGRIKEAVKILKEWLEAQPHLPHDYGKYCNWSLALLGSISIYLKFGGDYGGVIVTARALRTNWNKLSCGGTLHSSSNTHTHTHTYTHTHTHTHIHTYTHTYTHIHTHTYTHTYTHTHIHTVRKVTKSNLLASSCLSVCLSVRIETLGSQCRNFHEIWYLNIFRKSVEKIQISLKSDKQNGYFAWITLCIYHHIPLTSSYNEKRFRKKSL